MRSLILFRHGKSDWDGPFTSDHERPLAPRGKEAARCMGRMLHHAGQVPDLAISSSAVRARETLHHAVRAGKWHCEIRMEPTLYDTSASATLDWLKTLGKSPEALLLTGHEPTWSDLAGQLVGEAIMRVPTATMLRIDFEIDNWHKIRFGEGELRWLIPPKLICRHKGHR